MDFYIYYLVNVIKYLYTSLKMKLLIPNISTNNSKQCSEKIKNTKKKNRKI